MIDLNNLILGVGLGLLFAAGVAFGQWTARRDIRRRGDQ